MVQPIRPVQGLVMNRDLDDPAAKRRFVIVSLKLTPFAFVLAWVLAALQGAPAFTCTVIAGVAGGLILGAALSVAWFGSAARHVLAAIVIIVSLLRLPG